MYRSTKVLTMLSWPGHNCLNFKETLLIGAHHLICAQRGVYRLDGTSCRDTRSGRSVWRGSWNLLNGCDQNQLYSKLSSKQLTLRPTCWTAISTLTKPLVDTVLVIGVSTVENSAVFVVFVFRQTNLLGASADSNNVQVLPRARQCRANSRGTARGSSPVSFHSHPIQSRRYP